MSYLCVYELTLFYDERSKYCALSGKTTDPNIPQQARSAYKHRDNLIRFVAVGYELPQTNKVSMELDGEWKNGKRGLQLQVQSCTEIVPQTTEGIRGYLSSRLIKGVGDKTAAQIVDRFGADALKVIENEPEKLLEIRGITPAKLDEIKSSYLESRCLRDIMILLAPFQITPPTATKIYKHFGAKSVEILQKNPFELCQIPGFGFKRVDAILQKNGFPMKSPMRIHGAIFSVLECVSKLKLMNYREKGLANYRRIVYNRRSKNNEGAQIKWQDDTKLMVHSGKRSSPISAIHQRKPEDHKRITANS